MILQRRQKAEVNGFAAYRGKAHLKDNIREGMVGHQIVVLSFKTRLLDMQLLTSFCSKNGTLQKSAYLFSFLIPSLHARCSIVNGLFLVVDQRKSRELFQRHSCTSHWQSSELNRLKQNKATILWNKETMIEEGVHLSENGIKLSGDILVDRSSTISPPAPPSC